GVPLRKRRDDAEEGEYDATHLHPTSTPPVAVVPGGVTTRRRSPAGCITFNQDDPLYLGLWTASGAVPPAAVSLHRSCRSLRDGARVGRGWLGRVGSGGRAIVPSE